MERVRSPGQELAQVTGMALHPPPQKKLALAMSNFCSCYYNKSTPRVTVVASGKRIRLGTTRLWFDPWPRSMGSGSGIAMSCGVGHGRSSDPELLWHRPAATAPIQPLGWEPLYAVSMALKRHETKKKKKIISSIFSDHNGM